VVSKTKRETRTRKLITSKRKNNDFFFHEFNTNEPDFIASTGWTDLWKNNTVRGSSTSVRKKYRQIQNQF
jgi:hypothetical protein